MTSVGCNEEPYLTIESTLTDGDCLGISGCVTVKVKSPVNGNGLVVACQSGKSAAEKWWQSIHRYLELVSNPEQGISGIHFRRTTLFDSQPRQVEPNYNGLLMSTLIACEKCAHFIDLMNHNVADGNEEVKQLVLFELTGTNNHLKQCILMHPRFQSFLEQLSSA